MAGLESGYKEAIEGVIAGIIIQAFIGVFQTISIIPSTYVLYLYLIQIGGLIGDILLIATMPKRGVGFFVGWAFGMGIMVYAGLVETWLIILYIVVGVLTIFLKLWSDSKNSGYY